MAKQVVIFSHGFGVRKDDRGLLTDIAANLSEVEPVLFDYSKVDEDNHTITVTPLTAQAKMLTEVIEKTKQDNPGAIIDIITHSQGVVAPALAQPQGIRKVVVLAPSFDLAIERTIKRHGNMPGSEINLQGMSKLYPLDGYVRYVPAEYWTDRQAVNLPENLNKLADLTEVIVITANQDELLPKIDPAYVSSKIKFSPVDGDHNFTGKDRAPLIEVIRKLLL